MDMVERKISDKLRPDAILPDGSPNPKYLTPPSMVERVARAIAANKRGLAPDDPALDDKWQSYCGQARAAIAVMREPSEAMIRAMRGRALAADCLTDQGARDIYSNAMHAALGEG